MNQTTPPKNVEINWEDLKARAKEVIFFLPQFLKNPIEGMKRVPSWDWPTVIILEVLLTTVTSVLGGIVARHILAILGGLIVGPIMGLVLSFIIAGILYYCSLFILKTELEFRKVFVVVVLAKVPSQILGILSPLARPIVLVCIIFSALLLIVGMVENFMLDKKKVTQIVGTIAGLLIVYWIFGTIMDATTNHIKVQDYTPESLDQIHKELENK